MSCVSVAPSDVMSKMHIPGQRQNDDALVNMSGYSDFFATLRMVVYAQSLKDVLTGSGSRQTFVLADVVCFD